MYLLIDRIGRMIHQNGAFLVIQFPIHSRIANQVDDPFFAFVVV